MEVNHRTAPCKTTRIHVGRKSRHRVVILSIAAVLLLMIVLVAVLPQFRVQEITIAGCTMISPDELLIKSKIQKGDHLASNVNGGIIQLISLRYGKIEQELRSEYPYIDSITIQASFPSKVVITVEERQKIGYIQIPDGYAVIDMDGYVVELSGEEIPAQVPVMLGIPVRSAVLGHQIDMADVTNLNNCITVLGAILHADHNQYDESNYSLMQCVESIRSIDSNTSFLMMRLPSTQLLLLVRIGSLSDISDQMVWLRYAISKNAFDGETDGILDMSGDTMTFRQEK